MYDIGSIEILKYAPPQLLPCPLNEMDMDTFLRCLAMARVAQEMEVNNQAEAIAKVFGEQ